MKRSSCKAFHRFISPGGSIAADDIYDYSLFAYSPASLRNREGPPHPIASIPVSQNAAQGTGAEIRSYFRPDLYFKSTLSLIFITL